MRMLVKGTVVIAVLILAGYAGIAFGRWSRDRAAVPIVSAAFATVTVGDDVFRVELARTDAERERGLSGRAALAPGTGMLFVFDAPRLHAIWMNGMRFSIDVVWISGGMVLGTTEQLPIPNPGESYLPLFYPPEHALLVLELPAGTVAERSIARGDRVVVAFDAP